jgi:hypothetical protein
MSWPSSIATIMTQVGVSLQIRPSPGSCAPFGAGAVRAARRFQAEGTCDYAGDRRFARHAHAVQPEASSPAS